jgi:hypothetical protein
MPIDYRLVADLEEGLGDEHLSEIRFGRSRFLRNAGLALFGLAAGMFAPPPEDSEAAPLFCSGGPTCLTCRGARCTRCRSRSYACLQMGIHCWRTRVGCSVYRCCDWISAFGNLCICRGFVGNVC